MPYKGGNGTPLQTMNPRESSIAFIPIDLKANDETCIVSKMHFIVDQAKKIKCWPNINFWSAIIPKSVWNTMEGIRKQRIKENSFEAGCNSHLYEIPRLHWSSYVFKCSSLSATNQWWK